MEQSIVNAFTESIQAIMKESVAKMAEEARKFIIVATALVKLPVAVPPVSVPVHVPDGAQPPHQRPETTFQERTQKILNGIMEDIGELNSRVDRMQHHTPDWDDLNFPIPWTTLPVEEVTQRRKQEDGEFVFHEHTNELVLPATRVIHLDVANPQKEKEKEKEKEVKEEVEEEVKEEVKETEEEEEEEAEKGDVEMEEVKEEEAKQGGEPEEADDEMEEVEEEEELEELEFQGNTYYRDSESNIYKADKTGQVDDTPIGRWVKQSIKFYPV